MAIDMLYSRLIERLQLEQMSKKSISNFFTETLFSDLVNVRWSWGAVDSNSNRVFLRIWEDQIRISGSKKKAQIYWKNPAKPSPGYGERLQQISLLRKGAKGFGILTWAVDPQSSSRKMKDYRDDVLFPLGVLSEDDDGIYAEVGTEVPTRRIVALRALHEIPSDEELSRYEITVTEGVKGTIPIKVRRRC